MQWTAAWQVEVRRIKNVICFLEWAPDLDHAWQWSVRWAPAVHSYLVIPCRSDGHFVCICRLWKQPLQEVPDAASLATLAGAFVCVLATMQTFEEA